MDQCTQIVWKRIQVWKFKIISHSNFRGKGFVVAGADTGYDYTHEAIKKQYRGGENGPHDYHWWDAVKEPFFGRNSTCGFNSPKPCDDVRIHFYSFINNILGISWNTYNVSLINSIIYYSKRGTMCGEAPNRKIVKFFSEFYLTLWRV